MSTALQIADNRAAIAPAQPSPSFSPTTFGELEKYADRLAKSTMVPTQFRGKPDDIIVAVLFGAEVGLPPMQSLLSVCVINGRPGLFGDGFLGVIMGQPDFQDIEEDDLEEIHRTGKATCIITRKGRKPRKVTFTMEMAKLAGLTSKEGPWRTYPARQLQMRARGFCGRDVYSDRLRGIKIAEELADYDGLTIEADQLPQPSARASLPAGATASATAATAAAAAKPAAEAKPAAPTKITEDQAKAFGKAWKANGYLIGEAKDSLKLIAGVTSSLEIPPDKYDMAMSWANTPKPKPAEMTADQKIAEDLFGILNWTAGERQAAIDESKGDWAGLVKTLEAKLPQD
jgi:hypothetical protein